MHDQLFVDTDLKTILIIDLKNKIFKTRPNNSNDLKERIIYLVNIFWKIFIHVLLLRNQIIKHLLMNTFTCNTSSKPSYAFLLWRRITCNLATSLCINDSLARVSSKQTYRKGLFSPLPDFDSPISGVVLILSVCSLSILHPSLDILHDLIESSSNPDCY